MEIETNVKELIRQMKNRGWQVIEESRSNIILQNDILFVESILISIPLNKQNKSYPMLLLSSLKILLQVDEYFLKSAIVSILLAQAKNIKQKFSKDKRDWILSEPRAKYNIDEIPDIYIPKI